MFSIFPVVQNCESIFFLPCCDMPVFLCLFRMFTRLFLIRHRTRSTVVAAAVWDWMQVHIGEWMCFWMNVYFKIAGWWWLNIETGRKKEFEVVNTKKETRIFWIEGGVSEFPVEFSDQLLRFRRYCLILNRNPSEIKSLNYPKPLYVCVYANIPKLKKCVVSRYSEQWTCHRCVYTVQIHKSKR